MATPYERTVRTTVNHNPEKANVPKRSNRKAFMAINTLQYDWYAVAWEGTSSTPPENKIRLSIGETLSGFNNY